MSTENSNYHLYFVADHLDESTLYVHGSKVYLQCVLDSGPSDVDQY